MNRFAMVLAPMLLAGLLMAGAASAQEDAYTVDGVPIDATAATSAVAREQAIAEGAPRALRRLFERLVLADDMGRVPAVSSAQATSLAIGFQVDNELRSATRYRGELTVSFEPEGVRRILRSYGVPFVETPAPPTLVVPVYVVGGQASLWTANPWAEGWDEGRYIGGFAPVVLADGFAPRVSLISPQAVAAGDVDTMALLAGAYGVERVLLAVAEPQGDVLDVELTLFRFAEEPDLNLLGVEDGAPGLRGDGPGISADAVLAGVVPDAPGRPSGGQAGAPGEPEIDSLGSVRVRAGESPAPFQLAADRAHDLLAEDWKRRTVIRSQERTEMRITVLYDSIGEWHRLRQLLGGSPFVTDVRLDALSRDGAAMTLTYRGLREQLSSDLSRRGVQIRADARLGEVVHSSNRGAGGGSQGRS